MPRPIRTVQPRLRAGEREYEAGTIEVFQDTYDNTHHVYFAIREPRLHNRELIQEITVQDAYRLARQIHDIAVATGEREVRDAERRERERASYTSSVSGLASLFDQLTADQASLARPSRTYALPAAPSAGSYAGSSYFYPLSSEVTATVEDTSTSRGLFRNALQRLSSATANRT